MRAWVISCFLVLVGCDRSIARFAGEEAPRALTYAINPAAYTRNETITANVPTVSGGAATRFSLAPAVLPPGLLFDGNTGIITGTPLVVTALTNYRVTAANDAGAATLTLPISVGEAPPKLIFAGAPFVFVVGESAASGVPGNSGGPITACAQSGIWPDGLNVDTSTCAISGFPTTATPDAVYALALTGPSGITPASVEMAINNPLAIVPPSITLNGLPRLQQTFAALGGKPPYEFALSGPGTLALPDTAQAQYTSVSTPGSATLTVTDSELHTAVASIAVQRIWVDGVVTAVAADDAAVYVGGQFSRAAFFSAPSLFALDAAKGTPRFDFDPQLGISGGAVAAFASSGNALFIGGNFQSYRGTPIGGLAKISLTSGALAEKFARGVGFDGSVNALAVASDGKSIFVGGDFSSYQGLAVNGLARLDATTGALLSAPILATTVADPYPPSVAAVLTVGDTTYVGGFFDGSAPGATPFSGYSLIAIDAAGNLVSDFVAPVALDAGNTVSALAASNIALFVGLGTGIGPTPAQPLALDLQKGSAVKGFAGSVAANNTVNALAVGIDGVFVASNLDGGTLSKLDLDSGDPTSDDFNTVSALTNEITALAADATGVWIGASNAVSYSGTPIAGVMKIDASNGQPLTTFDVGLGFNSGGSVTALFPLADAILIGGSFSEYGGYEENNLAKINFPNFSVLDASGAALDPFNVSAAVFSPPPICTLFCVPPPPPVEALAMHDGSLIVGGDFAKVGASGATAASALAEFRSDGTFVPALSATANITGYVSALAYDAGGRLWVGGSFKDASGCGGAVEVFDISGTTPVQALPNIAVLTAAPSPLKYGAVESFFDNPTAQGGEVMFVGGEFIDYIPDCGSTGIFTSNENVVEVRVSDGSDAAGTVMYNAGFTGPGTAQVQGLLMSGSNVFIGGSFATLFSGTASLTVDNFGIEVTDGTFPTNQSLGLDAPVFAFAAYQTAFDHVFVGGQFTAETGGLRAQRPLAPD